MIRIISSLRVQLGTRAQRRLTAALAVLWIMGLVVNSLNPSTATGNGKPAAGNGPAPPTLPVVPPAAVAWVGDLSPISKADWNYDRAAHPLERAGFGGVPEEIGKLAAMTPQQAVTYLVYYKKVKNIEFPPFDASGIFPADDFTPPSGGGEHIRQAATLSLNDRISAFEKVWKIINEDFYDPSFNGVDWKGAYSRYRPRIEATKDDDEFYDLLSEMLAELRDSHTSFHRPKVYSGKKEKASNVGISVFPVDGKITVIDVEKDSEAAKAGIRAGMFVTTFDGKRVEERLAELKNLLHKYVGIATDRMLTVLVSGIFFSGDVNTSVSVGFEADDGRKLEVSMLRLPSDDKPTMTARRLDTGFGYIRFKPWVPPNDRRFADELRKLIDTPGLIIDLRGNRGGSFMTADYFLNPGTFTGTTVWRNGKVDKGYSRKSDLNYNGRLIVLVDEESGSASENFAALIQESGRGLVVGRQTCGCFTSSYYESVKGGGKLQWSRVLPRTIKGNKIEGRGVIPDKTVSISLTDLRQGIDSVLKEAERLLKSQLSTSN